MKSKVLKITTIIITMLIIIISIAGKSNAEVSKELKVTTTNIDQNEIAEIVKLNTNNLNLEEIRDTYNKLSSKYTNEELANMLEKNKQEIIKSGVSQEVIDAGTQILKTTGTEELRNIVNNDIDITSIQKKIDSGYTPTQIVKETMQNEQAVILGLKLLLANKVFQILLAIVIIKLIYDIIIKWAIFKKAKKPGWATLIPIYRHIAYLQICGISPWLILLVLVPVIGWLILAIIEIVARFRLATGFGRGFFFGIGLWLFPIIFETVLACSKKKYIGFE